jgi:cytochrome c oxidase subunit 1
LSEGFYTSLDVLVFSLHVVGLGSVVGAINFVVTVMLVRFVVFVGLGLSLSLFSVSLFITSVLILIAIPVLGGCVTLLLLDRNLGCMFFVPFFGGDVVLFQHLFWFFGHPEVYILVLPSFGLVSDVLSKVVCGFVFGRDSMIWALLFIGVLGCVV